MERVVVCIDKSGGPEFVIGPFVDFDHASDFLDKHILICKRGHKQRKLVNPKFAER